MGKSKPKSPTAQALAELRADGYEVGVVERRLPIPGLWVTQDLFGIIDLVAMKPGEPLLAVQVTSRSNINARITKALAGGKAKTWVSTGNKFEIVGFGGKKTSKRTVVMGLDGLFVEKGR